MEFEKTGKAVKQLVAVAAFSGLASGTVLATGQVNVYSYRQPNLVRPLFDAFSKKTGIKVNVLFAKKGLVARIKTEGKRSPADLIFTTDIGRLASAVRLGVTQPVKSTVLERNIPSAFRDVNGNWFGLTTRARVVFASRQRVEQNEISYEELADPKWKGRICVRSGQHVYNVALFASMIAHHGEEKTLVWLKGLKANLARRPAGNDRKQVKGVFSGQCDIAIGNTYYMGKMETNVKHPEQQEWARSVKILFPNTNGRGTHVNISGVALARFAPHRKEAVALMEFLSSDAGQKLYGDAVFEYPVKPGVAWSDRTKSWGAFKADGLSLNKIIKHRKRASELVDIADFNH